MSPTRPDQHKGVRRRGVATTPRERTARCRCKGFWLRATAGRECPSSYSSNDCIRVSMVQNWRSRWRPGWPQRAARRASASPRLRQRADRAVCRHGDPQRNSAALAERSVRRDSANDGRLSSWTRSRSVGAPSRTSLVRLSQLVRRGSDRPCRLGRDPYVRIAHVARGDARRGPRLWGWHGRACSRLRRTARSRVSSAPESAARDRSAQRLPSRPCYRGRPEPQLERACDSVRPRPRRPPKMALVVRRSLRLVHALLRLRKAPRTRGFSYGARECRAGSRSVWRGLPF